MLLSLARRGCWTAARTAPSGPRTAGPAGPRPRCRCATARCQAAVWPREQRRPAACRRPAARRRSRPARGAREVSAVSTPTYLASSYELAAARTGKVTPGWPEAQLAVGAGRRAAAAGRPAGARAWRPPRPRSSSSSVRNATSDGARRRPAGGSAAGLRRPGGRRAPSRHVGDRGGAAPVGRHAQPHGAGVRVGAVGEHVVDQVGGAAVGGGPGQRGTDACRSAGRASGGSARSGPAGWSEEKVSRAPAVATSRVVQVGIAAIACRSRRGPRVRCAYSPATNAPS